MTKVNPLEVKTINPDNDCIRGTLGVTIERLDELNKIYKHAKVEHDTITSALEVLSRECKSANELALVCIHIGVEIEHKRAKSE